MYIIGKYIYNNQLQNFIEEIKKRKKGIRYRKFKSFKYHFHRGHPCPPPATPPDLPDPDVVGQPFVGILFNGNDFLLYHNIVLVFLTGAYCTYISYSE